MEYRMVYITCKDREQALAIGRLLVESRLAACANIIDSMTSLYWWEGELVEDQETILITKNIEALTQLVADTHSYEVPCVVALPILAGNPAYLDWITTETNIPPTT